MAERGNKLNRFLDRYIGIPLTVAAAIFRKIDRRRREKPKETFKAAVICLGAIGDLLLLSGVIGGIKKLYPNAETTLFTSMDNRTAAPLIEGADRVYSFPISDFLSIISFMRRQRYDLLIDSTQWARIGAIISAFSAAGLTVGFKTKGEARSLCYDEVVKHSSLKHEWENFASLLKTDTVFLKPKLKICRETENLLRCLPSGDFIILHMFASGSYTKEREWGAENWCELAAYICAKGYCSVLTGNASEKGRLDEFICFASSKGGKFFNLAGKLNLEELSCLIRRATAVISVNTGVMHLAALCGAVTIALHGPTNPLRWGPLGDKAITLVPEGVTEFPSMSGGKIRDRSSFTVNIKTEEVIKCLEKILI